MNAEYSVWRVKLNGKIYTFKSFAAANRFYHAHVKAEWIGGSRA